MDSYYDCLDGNVSGFNVHKIAAPLNETGNYILIYPEGGVSDDNKSKKNEFIIIRVDIVTRFQNVADQSICETADGIIDGLIIPTGGHNGLGAQTGLQFLGVKRENFSYIIEQETSNILYRKVSRYINRVHQN